MTVAETHIGQAATGTHEPGAGQAKGARLPWHGGNALVVNAAETRPAGDGGTLVRVYWATGQKRKGAVDVKTPSAAGDPACIAEAVALRHLLGDRRLLNRESGNGMRLVVSRGAVKRVKNMSTALGWLYDYGYPLYTRYATAAIEVSKDKGWFPEAGELGEVPIIDAAAMHGVEAVDCGCTGTIGITRHALERYNGYRGTLNLGNAWDSLVKRLRGRLALADVPPRVARHKLAKYGALAEFWKHPDDTMHYVLVPKPGYKALVTVFLRNDGGGIRWHGTGQDGIYYHVRRPARCLGASSATFPW